jgi:2-desacetyl-2-hydroxyethyl bacteriochlorophyllide A dehydrogenase
MKGVMKAARFYAVNEPLKIETIPIPEIGPDEVLVDVKACGICGSDIHIVFEGVTPTGFLPITLGHEPSGVIAELGANVDDWKVGDRVAVSSIVTCGKCYNCLRGRESVCTNRKLLGIHLNGGLAEYMATPRANLIKLADNVPFDQGAAVTDAVATPFHAIAIRGKLCVGETVAIVGCGGLGIHGVQLANIGGASKVIAIDVDDEILERTKKVGATDTVNSHGGDAVARVKEIAGGIGVDLALEFVGRQDTIALGVESLKIGGRCVVCGLGPDNISVLPPTIFVRTELSVIGSYGWDRVDIGSALDLIAAGKLDVSGSITERFGLDDINTALDHLLNKVGKPIRIVITQD